MSKSISALISRVRAASGPDREIDGAIMKAVDPENWKNARHRAALPSGAPPKTVDRDALRYAPSYTASLDAVVALIEKRLPDGLWDVNGYGAAIVYPKWITGDVDTKYAETASSPALALLLAFLTAVEGEG